MRESKNMKPIRRIADLVENTAGLNIFRKRSGHHWPVANFERRLFDYLKVDCVFDVGANIGQFGQRLRREIKFEGTILSFEPNPAIFADLVKEAKNDAYWHCFPFALGATEENGLLNVTHEHSFSSILRPGGETQKLFPKENQIEEVVDIEIKPLRAIFKELQARFGFERPFLKMDTQGYDLEVVKGADLDEFCGALSEASFIPIYEEQPAVTETIAAFRASGWPLVELFNVHPGRWFNPLVECDCFFVRGDLAN